MFRHVVTLRWVEDAPATAVDQALAALRRLPDDIPEARSFVVGSDAGLAVDNHDCVVVADFDDRAAYERYATHPAHLALIDEHIRPVLADRVAVQHDLG